MNKPYTSNSQGRHQTAKLGGPHVPEERIMVSMKGWRRGENTVLGNHTRRSIEMVDMMVREWREIEAKKETIR